VLMWLQHNYHSPIFGICHIKKSAPKKYICKNSKKKYFLKSVRSHRNI
jgi:hypothetical protein